MRWMKRLPFFKSIFVPIHFCGYPPLPSLFDSMVGAQMTGAVKDNHLVLADCLQQIFTGHFVSRVAGNKKGQIDCPFDMTMCKFLLGPIVDKHSPAS